MLRFWKRLFWSAPNGQKYVDAPSWMHLWACFQSHRWGPFGLNNENPNNIFTPKSVLSFLIVFCADHDWFHPHPPSLGCAEMFGTSPSGSFKSRAHLLLQEDKIYNSYHNNTFTKWLNEAKEIKESNNSFNHSQFINSLGRLDYRPRYVVKHYLSKKTFFF